MIDRHALRAKVRRFAHGVADRGEALWTGIMTPFWRGMARRNRDKFVGTYVAVMGSCGKSTATMLAAAMLSTQRATELGLFDNTERHLLRYLRRLDRRVDCFVQELSEFPLGTIDAVSRAMGVNAAAVTMIGLDHRSAFRSHDAIAAEMAGLLGRLSADGFACLNADDAAVSSLSTSCSCRVVFFGVSASAELRAENVSARSGRLEFDLVIGAKRRHVETRFVGTLMLPSVLAALSIAHALDLDMDMAVSGLGLIEPLRRRMGVFSGADKHTYVVDTYKASHWSTLLFVEDIPNMGEGRRVFVLGEVSDIASDSSRRYRQLIRAAAQRCDLVIGIGRSAASAAEKVSRLEPGTQVVAARNLSDVSAILRDQPPSLVFLKGKKMGTLPVLSSDPLWDHEHVLGSHPPMDSTQ